MKASIVLAALAGLLPLAAHANCSSAELMICVHTPGGAGPGTESVCSYTQCATAQAVFEFYRFGNGSAARVDYTGDGTGLLNADIPTGDGSESYEDAAVDVAFDMPGFLVVGMGGATILRAMECDDRCAGIDADMFGGE